jgi:hypothetical protein
LTRAERAEEAVDYLNELVRREMWRSTERRMKVPSWMPKKLEAQLRRTARAIAGTAV